MANAFLELSDFLCLRRKFLVYNLILRNLKIRYRKSFLGMLWTVLIPAGSSAIYYVIFSHVLKVNVEHHLLYIVCGIIPWTFFSISLNSGMVSIFINHSLLNKIPLPIQSLVLSETITHFLNLLLSIPVIIGVMVITGVTPTWAVVQVFPMLALLFLFCYSLSLALAIAVVYFRDLVSMIALVLQFWIYLTPIMYTPAMIPEKMRFLIYLNPLGMIFTGLNSTVTDGYWLTANDWSVALGWTFGTALVAHLMLRYFRSSIVEII